MKIFYVISDYRGGFYDGNYGKFRGIIFADKFSSYEEAERNLASALNIEEYLKIQKFYTK